MWATTAQAARHYGVSDRHIRNLCKSGEVRSMRLGKLWRVWIEDEPPKDATSTAQEVHGM